MNAAPLNDTAQALTSIETPAGSADCTMRVSSDEPNRRATLITQHILSSRHEPEPDQCDLKCRRILLLSETVPFQACATCAQSRGNPERQTNQASSRFSCLGESQRHTNSKLPQLSSLEFVEAGKQQQPVRQLHPARLPQPPGASCGQSALCVAPSAVSSC